MCNGINLDYKLNARFSKVSGDFGCPTWDILRGLIFSGGCWALSATQVPLRWLRLGNQKLRHLKSLVTSENLALNACETAASGKINLQNATFDNLENSILYSPCLLFNLISYLIILYLILSSIIYSESLCFCINIVS